MTVDPLCERGPQTKIKTEKMRIRIRGKYVAESSLLRGTRRTLADLIVTEVALDSDEPPECVAQLIPLHVSCLHKS